MTQEQRDDEEITKLIASLSDGTSDARDRLFSLIYDELHRLAARELRRELPNHSLCPTELVNEAYLRLMKQRASNWTDRSHFFCFAAKVIRRVLVDHARARNARKRGGGAERRNFSTIVDGREIDSRFQALDVLALEDALVELAEKSAERAKVVELRFFAGLSVKDVAETMNVHEITVKRYWKFAQAWLFSRMSEARGTS